jgi:hypothetical protein
MEQTEELLAAGSSSSQGQLGKPLRWEGVNRDRKTQVVRAMVRVQRRVVVVDSLVGWLPSGLDLCFSTLCFTSHAG